MNKKIAMTWADNLDSGKFTQHRLNCLQDGKGNYCCLGVLNEMFQKETGIINTERQGNTVIDDGKDAGKIADKGIVLYSHNKDKANEFLGWSEMSTQIGDFVLEGKETNLAKLNDNGKTFPELAEIIRKNWKSL